jgi:hypothetical protein
MSERRAHGSIRFAVFFFLASAVFPSLSRAQVPQDYDGRQLD